MDEFQELAVVFISVAAIYLTTRRLGSISRKNDEIISFLDTLESDLEKEIERTEGFGTKNITDRHDDLKKALDMLRKLDHRRKRFRLEEILPIYAICNHYRVGYFKDSESDYDLNIGNG